MNHVEAIFYHRTRLFSDCFHVYVNWRWIKALDEFQIECLGRLTDKVAQLDFWVTFRAFSLLRFIGLSVLPFCLVCSSPRSLARCFADWVLAMYPRSEGKGARCDNQAVLWVPSRVYGFGSPLRPDRRVHSKLRKLVWWTKRCEASPAYSARKRRR